MNELAMRTLFVHWPQAVKEPDRLLDDLARWTDINAITLFYTSLSPSAKGGATPLVLPPSDVSDDLPVPHVTRAEFDEMARFAESARKRGFAVACNIAPIILTSEDAISLACVDITGRRAFDKGRTAVHGCPNNPDTLRFGTTLVREIVATWPSIDTLDFNHLEYPQWPSSGLSDLFVCFCNYCRDKADGEGIDFEQVRREAAALYDTLVTPHSDGPRSPPNLSANELLNFLVRRPHLATWLNFRTSSMSEFIRQVTEAGREAATDHNRDLKIGTSFQLPAISNLVGTDYLGLYDLFDWVSPKFPDYVPGSVIPVIADEIVSKGDWADISDLRRAIRELYDLGPGPSEYRPVPSPKEELTYSNAFDTSIIDRQMKHLEPLVGKVPMYPWIWLYNRDLDHLGEKVDALQRHGFDGYFLWSWEWDHTTEALKESSGVF